MKAEGLNITVECNLPSINFLDVTMTLQPHEHKPFMKNNSKLEYLDTRSNHLPNTKKNITVGVEIRLRDISSSERCFKLDIGTYQSALSRAEHKYELKYEALSDQNMDMDPPGASDNQLSENNGPERPNQSTGPKNKKKSSWKIIYFNPP